MDYRIAVSSTSFCKNSTLKEELLKVFPQSSFHQKKTDLSEEELTRFYAGAEGILVGTEKISKTVLEKNPQIKILSKYGVGCDNIDFQALKAHNVEFRMVEGVNRTCVAELTLMFLLGLAHNLPLVGYPLKSGIWNKDGGTLLREKTVGIIGCGHVGSALLELLPPFQCEVLVNDIKDKSEIAEQFGARLAEKREIFRKADFITLHVPLNDTTKKLISTQELSMMKPTAFVINTCRGEVIDIKALKSALMESKIRGAAMDVFESEPPTDVELLSLPNLLVTPHIGGNAIEARLAMGRAAIECLENYFGSIPS
jgi:D-3-phosphoglycerate dehydrogenase